MGQILMDVKKIVILYSGGLDSLIMEHFAKINYPNAEVLKVYFDIGQEYNWKELASLVMKDVIIHDMKWFEAAGVEKDGINSGNIFIPGRNLVLIALAASKYLPDEVWLGALQGEIHANATDKNYKFLDKVQDTIDYVLSPYKDQVRVRYPLAEQGWGKLDATLWAVENGLSVQEIIDSSSCMHGSETKCGRCVVCARRWGIFSQLGFEEKYTTHPAEAIEHQKMYLEMVECEQGLRDSHYDKYRRAEIIPALKEYYHTNKLDEIRSRILNVIRRAEARQ